AYYYLSDASLKMDVKLAPGLDVITKLNGVEFKWRESGEKSYGLIAQEVEKVLPEAVKTDANGKKNLNQGVLTGPIIEAIKELDAKVQKLETENAELRDRLERIER
ncbi:MAG: hypothetical protein UY99_C0003G0001, partial [Parcubacteria group bacterium GW2011_GWA1_59_11]